MLAAKPPQIVVKTLKGDWTQNSGYHAVESWLSLTTSRQLNVSGQNDDMAFGARCAFEELAGAQERDRWLVFPLPDATVLPDLDKNGFDRDGWRRPSFLLVPDGRCDAVAGFRHNRRFAASRTHSGSSRFFPDLKDLQKIRSRAAQAR